MQECFPEGSILSRYGGDEFVVYLKDVTKESVYIYMEKFQKMIADLTLATGEKVHLSASAEARHSLNREKTLSRCAEVLT